MKGAVSGQEQVMWYPHRNTRCFQGCFGGWEREWPEALFERCRNQQTDCADWSLRQCCPEWVASAAKSQFCKYWGHRLHNTTFLPPHLQPLPLCSMLLRIKRSIRHRSIIYVLQGYTVEKIRLLKSLNNINFLIQKCNHPEHRHQQRRTLNHNMCQKKYPCPKQRRILGCWQLSILI